MEIKFNDPQMIKYLQEGGAMEPAAPPAEEPAPQEPAQGGSPEEQIAAACQQALDTQDCQLAMQVCQAILQMMGGGAPAPEQAPPGQEPVYRKGGRLLRYQKKF